MSQTVTLTRQGGNPTFSSLTVTGPTNLSGSLSTSGSLFVSGSVFVSGSLIVSGSIIAQSLVVNTTSYNSGSNIFGSSPSNTQVFTGSMYVGGLISGSVFYGSGANLTQIPNAALTNSTISGISLGSNLGTLTFGTYLTGTSYNGSTGVTIATNATNANTVSTIVARDASGNFSAGTITAALSGNASTATQTNVTLTGTNVADVMYAAIADNDFARIRVGGTATNAGYLELATADDGTEPIYVRQYTGVFTSLTRTATLLDGSGNTSFPGTVTATFSGNITGNVTGNCSGTSNNITAYTINQSVGTGNSPTFSSATITNNITVSSGNTTGNGIILADDGDIVDLNDAYCSMRFSSGVRIFSANRGGSAVIKLGNGGDIIASSDITAYGSPSDINLKENIKPLDNSLSKILKLQGVTFDWKENSETRQYTNLKEDIGFIAQQVQEVIPELVRKNDNGLLSLRDRGLTALLVEAIKEQQKQIDELKAKLA